MVFDWTEKQNKKYIPLVTFVIGCAVGAVVMKWYIEKEGKKMADGGSIGSSQPASPTIIQVQSSPPVAPAAPVAAAPISTVSSLPV